jgi:hypothetical protein
MQRVRWTAVVFMVLTACSDGDAGGSSDAREDIKQAACRQIFLAACETFVRCGAFPADTDCDAAVAESTDADFSDCTQDVVDDFTQEDVDACSNDMRVFDCAELCGQVPEDPPSCQALSPVPNTEIVECGP